jgi:diguanylate cyclase (GGDEF)-like protein/PAS domain S-box-containing protein
VSETGPEERRTVSRHRPAVAWFGVGLLATVTIAAAPPTSTVGGLAYLVATVAAAAVAGLGARHAEGRSRGVVRPLAVAVLLSAGGDLAYAASYLAAGEVRGFSVADVGWLGAYLALAVALLRLLREHHDGRRQDVDGLIDLLAVVVVMLLLAWELVIAPTLMDTSLPLAARLRESTFPVASAAVLALVVRVVATRRQRTRMVAFIAAGTLVWFLADTGYLVLGSVEGDNALARAAWGLGGLLLAAAVWQRVPADGGAEVGDGDPGTETARLSLALVPLTVPPLIHLARTVRGDRGDGYHLVAVMLVLLGLAFARTVRLSQDAAATRELVRRQARLTAAMAANAADAVVLLDGDRRIVRDAAPAAALVGRRGALTVGRTLVEVARPVDPDALEALLDRAAEEPDGVVDGEIAVVRPDGSRLWLGVRVRDLRADPDVGGLICNLQDVTVRRQAEAQLAHRAWHDDLTGVANRAALQDRLTHALERAARDGPGPALVYLDLDGFKDVNDRLGHDAGDRLLREVADRLSAVVRPADTVARIGGDEFVVLIEAGEHPREEAEVVATRILDALREPVELDEEPIAVSASLGVATAGPGASTTSLLREADTAMYRAKQVGNGSLRRPPAPVRPGV